MWPRFCIVHAHQKGIIHRDIKLGNLLISHNDKVQLADFGISTRNRNPEDRKTIIGTEGYMAPEIEENTMESEQGSQYLQRVRQEGAAEAFNVPVDIDLYDTQYTEKVDIFSLGTTLYAMLTGKLPEDTETEYDSDFDLCFEGTAGGGMQFDMDFAEEILSLDALDLILAMLDEDPESRISLEEIQSHPWIQSCGSV